MATETEYDWETVTCKRCGDEIADPAIAHTQKEVIRMNGRSIKCTATYCRACAVTLRMIGAGERTDMQARAGHQGSDEAETKAD